MNDLLPIVSSSRRDQQSPDHHAIEITGGGGGDVDDGGVNLNKFFGDVYAIKEELNKVEQLKQSLKRCHELSKTLHKVTEVKDLCSTMEADVAFALTKAKSIKLQLDSMERSNADHRSLHGPGSSSDRTRTSVLVALKKKFKDSLDGFNELRLRINSEYRETVQRRYFTVTGKNPDEKTLDFLISTGESESFLQKAIEEQGMCTIEGTMKEIEERQNGMKELEKNLKELHQVFLDMAVLVQSQGEQLNNIENHLERANSFVRTGTQQLQTADKHLKSSKCSLVVIIFLFILILAVPFMVNSLEK